MGTKYICCIHDKKSDTFDGFTMYDNMSQAIRSFQQSCEKIEVFQKWPEDFEFVLVGKINFENGTLNEKNEIEKKGEIKNYDEFKKTVATATDFLRVQKNETNS